MRVFRDESTGYLVIDDLSEGVDILPSELYQSYLRRIKELEEEVSELKGKFVSIAENQAKEAAQQQENKASFLEFLKETATSERSIGFAMGLFAHQYNTQCDMAKYYFAEFQEMFDMLERSGQLEKFNTKVMNRYLADNSTNEST